LPPKASPGGLNIVLSALALLLVSCGNSGEQGLFPQPEGTQLKSEEKVVFSLPPRVLWKTELETLGVFGGDILYTDNFVYLQESLFSFNPGEQWCRVVKVRLSDGAVIWRTKNIEGYETTSNIIKSGGGIYVANGDIMLAFSDADGRLEATIRLGKDDEEARRSSFWWPYAVVSGPYLFWGNSPNTAPLDKVGLLRLDIREIDYTRPPEEPQNVNPGLVWGKTERLTAITTQMIAEKGIVYFITGSSAGLVWTGKSVCNLVAMNVETLAVVWEKELYHTIGAIDHSLVINGDYLHILDWASSCYNKYTGAVVYENQWVDF
jgi:hypothetical protein